jgi:uncharacterized SAM-binding protein YcdF (DUF218 family)
VAVRRFSLLKVAIALLAFAAVVYLSRAWWLTALASALVHDDGPGKADIAVVLGGDTWGHRIVRGAELVKQGYVPAVLVSGPPGFYGLNEADVAIPFAVSRGYPREWFIPLPHSALSTRAEAVPVLAELRRRNVHTFLLVTTTFHTARARRIYLAAERDTGGGPSFRMVAATDQFFSVANWWRSRQAEKIVLQEWTKTFATAIGM